MPCKGKFCTRILTKNFSLGGFYSSTAIFLYAERALSCITEKIRQESVMEEAHTRKRHHHISLIASLDDEIVTD